MLGFMLRHVGTGSPALQRLRLAANLVVTGGKGIERGLMSHCLTTAQMAERLGLRADVCGRLQQMFTGWDGQGVPGDVGGNAIAFSMRLFHLADTVEVFHRAEGVDAAIAVARARRGRHFDPTVVDAFCALAPQVLGDTAAEPDWNLILADEPALQRPLSEGGPDAALEAMADFTDLRSPARAGHSRGVAELVAPAAADIGLGQADIVALRRAGLLTTSACAGYPRRSSTSPVLCRPRSPSACGCTPPTTPSGCCPGRRRWPGSAPSPRWPGSDATARDTTGDCPVPPSRSPDGCSPRPAPTVP
jgi:hypothetical protein